MDVQLFTYDALGNRLLTCQDLDLDGQIDLAGPDRVTGQATRYIQLSGDWHQESASWIYLESGSAVPLTNAIARTRLTGFGGAYSADGAAGTLTAESVSVDARGNETVSRTVIDRSNKTVYRLTYTPGSTVAALSTTVNGLLVSSRSTSGLVTAYAYDALGRMTASQDARGAVHSRGYDEYGRVAWESDPATNGTWYAYDGLGRRTAVTNALGQVTHTAYDAEGRTIATWGATYPVAYEYDTAGRMTAMATTRSPAEITSAADIFTLSDRTTWSYDQPTGLLTNKLYADGKGTAYTYTPDGKLASRLWARGVTTTYAHDDAGSLTNIVYSDATPDVTFAYDRRGRQVSATVAGVSTNLFVYDGLDLVSETQNGVVLSRATDVLGREQSLSLNSGYQSIWNYDTLGRVDGVAWAMPGYTNAALFGRIANSDLSAGWSIRPVPVMGNFSQIWSQRSEIAAADPLFAHERGNYDLRGLVGEVANTADTEVFSLHRYDHDALGRRTARVDSGAAYPNAAFDRYGYNGRSEVVSGQRYYGTDSADTSKPYGGRAFGYDYDGIGNRLTATEQVGGATLTRAYTANALNQYTAIDNPAAVGLRGEAVSNATVTVNSETVARDQPVSDTWPWHFALDADNDVGPDFPLAEIAAVINPPGTNDPDIVELRSGFLYAPPQVETMTHDDDGNLTGDGRYLYAWDAENRLVTVEEQVCPTNRTLRRVEYDYDHQSRRIARHDYIRSGSQWQLETTGTFVYDGWNLIAETIHNQQSTITNLYVWGLDLSGTRTGAGGIGGLLAAVLATNDSDCVCAAYGFDANGNVTVLAAGGNDESFVLASSLEYDPFGRIIAQRVAPGNEPLAAANRYRFSTKWQDPFTRLSDYGYRWYDAERGRWINRDPIGNIQPSGFRRKMISSIQDPEVLELLKTLSGVMLSTDMNDVDCLLNDTLTQEANLHVALFNAPVTYYDPDGRFVVIPGPTTGKALCALIIGVIQKYQTAPNWRYTHCMASCRIKKVCGLGTAIGAGLAKELWDLAKCVKDIVLTGKADSDACYSAFQPSDFEDNAQGYKCPRKNTCAEQCQNLQDEPDAPPGPFYKCCEK